uniref:Uncharacterized protein n=1 Tax=Molossus molossus TaxID=27622 RepID=A0A7J8CZI2_MOLMO|nr:hypothetical protein HJG59_009544 [Molossus molossus]
MTVLARAAQAPGQLRQRGDPGAPVEPAQAPACVLDVWIWEAMMWKRCLKPSGDSLGSLPNLRELRLDRNQLWTLPWSSEPAGRVCLDVLGNRPESCPRSWGLALPTDLLLSQNLLQWRREAGSAEAAVHPEGGPEPPVEVARPSKTARADPARSLGKLTNTNVDRNRLEVLPPGMGAAWHAVSSP